MEDLHAADVVFVASHSQGCIISTHLVDRLIRDGHILTSRSVDILRKTAATIAPGGAPIPASQAQKICFLALCGIHLGPLRYLKTSSLLQPYIQVSQRNYNILLDCDGPYITRNNSISRMLQLVNFSNFRCAWILLFMSVEKSTLIAIRIRSHSSRKIMPKLSRIFLIMGSVILIQTLNDAHRFTGEGSLCCFPQ